MSSFHSNADQQGEVYHYHGRDGGEITIDNGFVTMTKYYETAVYDCLFGGNEKDDGSKSTFNLQWCGNEGEEAASQSRGKFQSMLSGDPMTSAKLPEYEVAALSDIKTGMNGHYQSVVVSAYASEPDRLDLQIEYTDKNGLLYIYEIKGIAA